MMSENNKKTKKSREGWKEAIIKAGPDDEQLLQDFPNNFDKSEWMWDDLDETEYLKKSPKNAKRLDRSITDLKQGKGKKIHIDDL